MKLPSLLLLFACACAAEAEWQPVQAPTSELADDARFAEALSIKTAMVDGLTAKLGAALAESGPAGAIEVCRTVAPEAVAKMQQKTGAKVGRTSHKLRNPGNRAPVWLAEVVAANAAQTEASGNPKQEPGTLAWTGPEGQLGVAFPLPVQDKCLACHGTEDTVAESTRAALRLNYPGDQATGFHSGDLRGWLWVELR